MNHRNFERTLRCWDIPSSMPVGVAVPITHLYPSLVYPLLLDIYMRATAEDGLWRLVVLKKTLFAQEPDQLCLTLSLY